MNNTTTPARKPLRSAGLRHVGAELARRRVERCCCRAGADADSSLGLLAGRRRTPADSAYAGLPGCLRQIVVIECAGLSADRNHVSQLADRFQITKCGQPRKTKRVKPVAGENVAPGTYEITIRYDGDASNEPAWAAPVTLTVT